MQKDQRNRDLRELWRERPANERTMNDVLKFCGWLEQNRPELMPPSRYGDPYQQLKSILKGLIQEE